MHKVNSAVSKFKTKIKKAIPTMASKEEPRRSERIANKNQPQPYLCPPCQQGKSVDPTGTTERRSHSYDSASPRQMPEEEKAALKKKLELYGPQKKPGVGPKGCHQRPRPSRTPKQTRPPKRWWKWPRKCTPLPLPRRTRRPYFNTARQPK